MNSKKCEIKSVIYLFFVLLKTISVKGQDCKVPGEYCMDDSMCCGGCCREKTCISSTQNCVTYDDPCMENYCPEGFDCHLFKPDYAGSETQSMCLPSKNP